MTDSFTVDVDERNINDILQKSMQTPVLLDFWSGASEACKTIAPLLTTIAEQYQGKFIHAKVDADTHPQISQQLGVQSVPALKLVVKGQLAGELNGAQSEEDIRKFLEPHVGEAPAGEGEDPFVTQIQRARAVGAIDDAISSLESAIKEQPAEMKYQALYADVLMDAQRIDDAEAVINNMGDDPIVPKAKAKVFFVRMIDGAEAAQSLQAKIESEGGDSESRYLLGAYCLLAGQEETGLNLLLSVMMNDRGFKEDGARVALLSAFDYLGTENPLTSKYRRKMFALLH
ncbi:hypothetical protein A9Q99_20760 [Gammaproteobacteria bacterium 45_16_T64]|nr:hypothetical protein A9Q99_20760 [Gammaproteobacteria bacterium 45_16_T64]